MAVTQRGGQGGGGVGCRSAEAGAFEGDGGVMGCHCGNYDIWKV